MKAAELKIIVDKIPEEGQTLEGQIEATEIALDMPGYGLTEPVAVAGRVEKVGHDVYLKGTLRGIIDSECSRCLMAFKMPISLDLSIVYVPEKERLDGEDESLGPDSNVSFYEGDFIEILPEVKELIIVSLPIKPVCRPECKGLCPHCGADLNVASCDCEKVVHGSAFEKLKELKAKLEGTQQK